MEIADDIQLSILPMLPVKSLLRFMCVRKSWYSLIKSSAFKAKHDRHHRVIKQAESDDDEHSHLLYVAREKKGGPVCTINMLRDDASKLSYVKGCELVVPLSDYNIVGVCEGLILLTEKSFGLRIYIWNPLVGTMKDVTRPASKKDVDEDVVLGFGFANNDYKIIRIIDDHNQRLYEVEMYSLETDSWRSIYFRHSYVSYGMWWNAQDSDSCTGFFFEGSVYWLSSKHIFHEVTLVNEETEASILRFDLETETFEIIKGPQREPISSFTTFPTRDRWVNYRRRRLVVLNGSLALLKVSDRSRGVNILPVQGWVMKKNESSSLWIRTESIEVPESRIESIEVCQSGTIACITTDRSASGKQGWKVIIHEYSEDSAWKSREMKISKKQTFDIVRVKETLALIDLK